MNNDKKEYWATTIAEAELHTRAVFNLVYKPNSLINYYSSLHQTLHLCEDLNFLND